MRQIDPMEREQQTSDLIARFQHEHDHVDKLIADLERTFKQIASGNLEGQARKEALESAAEDLAVSLEDMLAHFDHEEEFFFVAIEQRFPEYRGGLRELAQSHEEIYALMRALRAHLQKPVETIESQALAILGQVARLHELVEEHNENEAAIFSETLSKLPEEERYKLALELDHL